MFNHLWLEDFKCFTEEEVEFKDLTLFAGANGSGKSSIIQALLLLSKVNELENDKIINVNETFGVSVGGPKTLVSQNALGKHDCDFYLKIDNDEIMFNIDKENGLDLRFEKATDLEFPQINYVHAERIGPRMIYSAGGEKRISQNGENATYLMEYANNNDIIIPELLMLDKRRQKFSAQVENWMSVILGDLQIKSKVDAPKAQSELKFANDMTGEAVLPTLTGFGISYVFPIVVAGLLASSQKNQLLIIENPEAYLHPSAQSAIGKFLALIAKSGVQVVVETHSEHVIDGARLQMMVMGGTKDVLVNYIRQNPDKPEIVKLYIDENGELEKWPDGFFDQKKIDLREMFRMRMVHGDN